MKSKSDWLRKSNGKDDVFMYVVYDSSGLRTGFLPGSWRKMTKNAGGHHAREIKLTTRRFSGIQRGAVNMHIQYTLSQQRVSLHPKELPPFAR